MKKLFLLLLLLSVSSYGQTLQNPTFGNTTTNTLKVKTPATVTSVNFLPAFDADGQTVSKIAPIDVNIPYAPTNYSASTQTIGNHLAGIDTKLGQIPVNYSKIVYVNSNNPNSATIFSLDVPPVVNDDLLKNDVANLYIGLDASTWVYSGSNYITKVVTSETSNFFLSGTNIDAQGNKSANISRTGAIEGKSFIKTGGTQDEYQMANGSSKKIDLERVLNLSPHVLGANFLENKNTEKSISLNTRRNIFVNSETYTNGNFVSAGTGMVIDNTDTFFYNGIKMSRFKGTAYQSNITLRQSILTAGKRYILSFYVKNNNPSTTTNRFIWFNTIGTVLSGHGARYVDNNIRRVSYMFQAAGAQGVYANTVPTEPIGTGSTSFLTMAVSKTTVAPFVDLYIGGIQIEEIPDTYVDGVVWMGDSTIQANSGTNNAYNSVAIPRWFEGVLNCTSYNVAVAGETMAQMDARWATSVTPIKPNSKYVVIQGGVNDISQGRSLSDMQASLNSMNTKALADGFIPVFLTCTPNGAFSVAQEALRNDYNLWLKNNFKRVIDINAIVEQEGKIMVATPNSLFDNDGTHYGVSIRKAIAEFMAKSGFFEFLNPSDYQATTSTYTGKDLVAKNVSAEQITITVAPITSAGGYDVLTRNTTTGLEEKVPSTTFSPNLLTGFTATTGTITGTDTVLQAIQKLDGNVALKANASDLPSSGSYVPTLTSVNNVSSTSLLNASWTRIGNIVTVQVGLTITPTATATDTVFTISLPTNRATSNNKTFGNGSTFVGNSFSVTSLSTSNVSVSYKSTDITAGSLSASFQYSVLD